MSQPQAIHTVIVQDSSNALGLAGLIFSVLGWLTCGLLCIIGAPLSFLGLFSKGSKGTAVAGLIVGFPGVIFFGFVGLGLITAFLGIGEAAQQAMQRAETVRAEMEAEANKASQGIQLTDKTSSDQPQITSEIINEPAVIPHAEEGPLERPSIAEPPMEPQEQLAEIEDTPEPKLPPIKEDPTEAIRTFSDRTGKFKVEATVKEYVNGKLKLRRQDNGKVVEVALEKLSESDQYWVKQNFPH
jgi:hypothetical protein